MYDCWEMDTPRWMIQYNLICFLYDTVLFSFLANKFDRIYLFYFSIQVECDWNYLHLV